MPVSNRTKKERCQVGSKDDRVPLLHYALVVIDKISTSVEDWSIVVYLDAFQMVRGMSKHNVSACINQTLCKGALLLGCLKAPV